MRLRSASEDDAQAVTKCVQAAYRHYIERIGRAPAPMGEDYARAIREARVTVAESGGKVVGVLVLAAADGELLLENVAVAPSYQHKGLGAKLVAHAEAEALRRGFGSLCLYTHEKMTENRTWYAKLGYVELDRRSEHGFARVYYRKPLR